MVNLHKFFETDSALYLLLQYASGGRLWSYIAAYLQQSSGLSANATNMDNYFNIGAPVGNIYTGHKMFESTNTVLDNLQKKPGENQSVTAAEILRPGDPVFSPTGVRFSKLREEIESPEDQSTKEEQKSEHFDGEGDRSSEPIDSRRLSSLSSDEFHRSLSQEEVQAGVDHFPTSLEGMDQFQDLLKKNKVNLENFSINSFDSDYNAHLSSTLSTSQPLEEVDDQNMPISAQTGSVTHGSFADEVFSESFVGPVLSETAPSESSAGLNSIVETSRQLLRSVERTLSEADDKAFTSENHLQPKESIGEHSGQREDVVPERDSSESDEISIYDLHRTSDEDDSAEHASLKGTENGNVIVGMGDVSVTVCCHEPSSKRRTSQTEDKAETLRHLSSVADDIERGSQLDNSSVMKQNGIDLTLDGEVSTRQKSASFTSSPTLSCSPGKRSISFSTPLPKATVSSTASLPKHTGRKVSFCRSISGDMTRSASFECDVKSPTRNRARAISDLFENLDRESVEQMVLPETVVQRWAAELVIALSRLHSLGIICR